MVSSSGMQCQWSSHLRKKERKEGSKKKVASSRLYRRVFFFFFKRLLFCSVALFLWGFLLKGTDEANPSKMHFHPILLRRRRHLALGKRGKNLESRTTQKKSMRRLRRILKCTLFFCCLYCCLLFLLKQRVKTEKGDSQAWDFFFPQVTR